MTHEEAKKLAIDAYIWGYPLVTMLKTKQLMTQLTPINEFIYKDELLTPEFTDVVTPNVDTLYASAWLDLSKQPLILHVPIIDDRYYTLQFLDVWTNSFAYVGQRTTGAKEGDYLIVGPLYSGSLPNTMPIIKAPTTIVWLIVRILVKNKNDVSTAKALLHAITLAGLNNNPPTIADTKPDLSYLDLKPGSSKLFDLLGQALLDNEIPADEKELMHSFAAIGIGPGRMPSREIGDEALQKVLQEAAREAEQLIDARLTEQAKQTSNSWLYNLNVGQYGKDYLLRAAIAKHALGANVPEESVYALAFTDQHKQPLIGTNNYRIHFTQLFPVNAFWSITMYDNRTHALVPNPLERYALGDRSPLTYNSDGSLEIYIQHDKPNSKHIANWLPAPICGFYLVLRFYLPKEALLKNEYHYPLIEKYD